MMSIWKSIVSHVMFNAGPMPTSVTVNRPRRRSNNSEGYRTKRDRDNQGTYQPTAEYNADPASRDLSSSTNSIGHYSEISQKSREDDQLQMSYESLDRKSVADAVARQPAVYDDLAWASCSLGWCESLLDSLVCCNRLFHRVHNRHWLRIMMIASVNCETFVRRSTHYIE